MRRSGLPGNERAYKRRKGHLHSLRKLERGRIRRIYRATRQGGAALAVGKRRARELLGELFED